MNPPFRFSSIRAELRIRLQVKTSWGRNELLNLLDEVLLEQADKELEQLHSTSPFSREDDDLDDPR